MDKKLAGLIGAASAVATLSGAQAATAPAQSDIQNVMRADSYADLLAPIPNARAVLEAVDAAAAKIPATAKADEAFDSKVAQYFYHDHHHHHHSYRRFYHHHHHHGYWRPRFRHHHHHHHHHNYYRY